MSPPGYRISSASPAPANSIQSINTVMTISAPTAISDRRAVLQLPRRPRRTGRPTPPSSDHHLFGAARYGRISSRHARRYSDHHRSAGISALTHSAQIKVAYHTYMVRNLSASEAERVGGPAERRRRPPPRFKGSRSSPAERVKLTPPPRSPPLYDTHMGRIPAPRNWPSGKG